MLLTFMPAACSAVASVLNEPAATAVSTMSLAWTASDAAARAVAMISFFMEQVLSGTFLEKGSNREAGRHQGAGRMTRSMTWMTPLLVSTSVPARRVRLSVMARSLPT
jgi:hypothetical protein